MMTMHMYSPLCTYSHVVSKTMAGLHWLYDSSWVSVSGVAAETAGDVQTLRGWACGLARAGSPGRRRPGGA